MTRNGECKMARGKSKTSPIRVKFVRVIGPTIILVEPEDFVELIAGKDLTIIQSTSSFGWPRNYTIYTYVAPDSPITYYTKSREELTELHVDIIADFIEWRYGFQSIALDGELLMEEDEPKHAPLRAVRFYMLTGLIAKIYPEDLIDLVAEKGLTVVSGIIGRRDKYHIYIAHDPSEGITYYSVVERELTELTVDILADKIIAPFSRRAVLRE